MFFLRNGSALSVTSFKHLPHHFQMCLRNTLRTFDICWQQGPPKKDQQSECRNEQYCHVKYLCSVYKLLNKSIGKHVCLSFTETTQNPNLISVLTARNPSPTQATLLSIYESTQELNLTPVTTARRPSDSSVTYSNTTGAVMVMFFCFVFHLFMAFSTPHS